MKKAEEKITEEVLKILEKWVQDVNDTEILHNIVNYFDLRKKLIKNWEKFNNG